MYLAHTLCACMHVCLPMDNNYKLHYSIKFVEYARNNDVEIAVELHNLIKLVNAIKSIKILHAFRTTKIDL